MTTEKENKVGLVVTTIHKGVFFGYGIPTTEKIIRLEHAQMCIYWNTETNGVLGLAASGPLTVCKVTKAVPALLLHDVTAVMEASAASIEKWNVYAK